jgi:hypothetical protein
MTRVGSGTTQITTPRQGQERFLRVREKFVDLSGPVSKERFNGVRRTIAESNPENLWWIPFQETSLPKISVLRHDRQAVFAAYAQIAASGASRSPTCRT